MSAGIYFTDAARGQLRTALSAKDRRDPMAARSLLRELAEAARDGDLLAAKGARLGEFPKASCREVRVGEYRLFFRYEAEDLWIVGIWKLQKEVSNRGDGG
jgi:plasmid stabilization system protein ParE